MAATPKETVERVINAYLNGEGAQVMAEFETSAVASGHRQREHYASKAVLDRPLRDEAGTPVAGPMTARAVADGEVQHFGGSMALFSRTAGVQFPGEDLQEGRWTVVMKRFRSKDAHWESEVKGDPERVELYGAELDAGDEWWLIIHSHFSVPQG